jgi:Asp-tRNA(Asn)/Glu-tRNA(Gln) amidotransferase A subunit family amidase
MTVEIAWPTASPAELTEVAALLRAGDLSSVELTETMLDRIAAHNGALKSY